MKRRENVAVLCRSNRECLREYKRLSDTFGIDKNKINLLGKENLPLYKLRAPGALLDLSNQYKSYEFLEDHVWKHLLSEFEDKNFADSTRDRAYLEILFKLLCKEVRRPRIRDLQSFIREMSMSDIQRLKTKVGPDDAKTRLTIATIHKIKGLEFDTVFIISSRNSFPLQPSTHDVHSDAAEEARLLYVAMTRARNRLYLVLNNEEKNQENYHHFYLKGLQKEIFISWPGLKKQVDGGLQEYIEKNVAVDDPLSLNRGNIFHRKRLIGKLSNYALSSLSQSSDHHQLKVSNVIRYFLGKNSLGQSSNLNNELHETIQEQGWFYTVLVEDI
jgi:ATP-dependent exoDNAse (exonuclease V) beta subunit